MNYSQVLPSELSDDTCCRMEGPERVVCCTLCLCMAVAVFSSVALVYLTALVYVPARYGRYYIIFIPVPLSENPQRLK